MNVEIRNKETFYKLKILFLFNKKLYRFTISIRLYCNVQIFYIFLTISIQIVFKKKGHWSLLKNERQSQKQKKNINFFFNCLVI